MKSSIFSDYIRLKSRDFHPENLPRSLGPALFRQEGCFDHDSETRYSLIYDGYRKYAPKVRFILLGRRPLGQE